MIWLLLACVGLGRSAGCDDGDLAGYDQGRQDCASGIDFNDSPGPEGRESSRYWQGWQEGYSECYPDGYRDGWHAGGC